MHKKTSLCMVLLVGAVLLSATVIGSGVPLVVTVMVTTGVSVAVSVLSMGVFINNGEIELSVGFMLRSTRGENTVLIHLLI